MKKNSKKISLLEHSPLLAREWHPTKNKDVDISKIGYGSHKKVWWKCSKCGYEWEAKIFGRSIFDYYKCPTCCSLGMVNPLLSKEWSYRKNTNTPFDVTPGSQEMVWWEHSIGNELHEWRADVNSRNNGNGCPYCSGKKVCLSNCLKIKLPQIAKEWHPTKNGKISPFDVTQGSNLLVWWKCSKCAHDWKTEVYHRNDGNGCPKCSRVHKIILKDGTRCDSKTEAFFYLKYKKEKKEFIHDERYGKMGKRGWKRYDFFFPKTNTYVEVTGFNKKDWRNGKWFRYLRGIVSKRKYVISNLGANFKFICYILSKEDKNYVEKNIKK